MQWSILCYSKTIVATTDVHKGLYPSIYLCPQELGLINVIIQ